MKEIGKCLRWSDMTIWVGFSFLVRKQDSTDDIIYCYAAKELAYCTYKLHSEV